MKLYNRWNNWYYDHKCAQDFINMQFSPVKKITFPQV